MRLNSYMFTRVFSGFISLAIIVCQSIGCSTHPRFLCVIWVLLIYIHRFLSSFTMFVGPVTFTAGFCVVVVGGVTYSVI
jgi:hypothetical protein